MMTEKEFMDAVEEYCKNREFQIADCREYPDGKYDIPKERKVSPRFLARNIYGRFVNHKKV